MRLFGAGAFLIVLIYFLVVRWPPEDGWKTVRYIERETANYNLKFTGDWTEFEKTAAIGAAHQVGMAMSRERGTNVSAADMFNCFYGLNDYKPMEIEKCPCNERELGAEVLDTRHIRFYGAYSYIRYMDADERTERLLVHELGHATEDRILEIVNVKVPRRVLYWTQINNYLFPMRNRCKTLLCGFFGGVNDWQFNTEPTSGEEFADMFVGWAYSSWESSPEGIARDNFMKTHMGSWIAMGCTQDFK
jgi:hypothetical protein